MNKQEAKSAMQNGQKVRHDNLKNSGIGFLYFEKGYILHDDNQFIGATERFNEYFNDPVYNSGWQLLQEEETKEEKEWTLNVTDEYIKKYPQGICLTDSEGRVIAFINTDHPDYSKNCDILRISKQIITTLKAAVEDQESYHIVLLARIRDCHPVRDKNTKQELIYVAQQLLTRITAAKELIKQIEG